MSWVPAPAAWERIQSETDSSIPSTTCGDAPTIRANMAATTDVTRTAVVNLHPGTPGSPGVVLAPRRVRSAVASSHLGGSCQRSHSAVLTPAAKPNAAASVRARASNQAMSDT
mgnify:CR=1 FL=1